VSSPYLAAAGATWDEGPTAGGWIAARLGPLGPTVGHAVPRDYDAYAIVEIPWSAEVDVPSPALVYDALFDVLSPFTGAQVVHSGVWDGFSGLHAELSGLDAEPLRLPHREYHLWSGPLRSAMAFRHEPHSPPSLIWPDDRSWFVGTPIYSSEIAVGGPPAVIEAIVGDGRLSARRAGPDDELDIDD